MGQNWLYSGLMRSLAQNHQDPAKRKANWPFNFGDLATVLILSTFIEINDKFQFGKAFIKTGVTFGY